MPVTRPILIQLLAHLDQALAEGRELLAVISPKSDEYARTLLQLTDLEAARDNAETILRAMHGRSEN